MPVAKIGVTACVSNKSLENSEAQYNVLQAVWTQAPSLTDMPAQNIIVVGWLLAMCSLMGAHRSTCATSREMELSFLVML